MKNSKLIIDSLQKLYPKAKCELNHRNNFQLLIAVVLSAQTTDERVNMVTPELFGKYRNAEELSKADLKVVEQIIKPIGLYHSKAVNIIKLSDVLVNKYKGKVPKERKELEALPGVGRKTANVILSNCFNVPAFAVDTHVSRVSKRLGIVSKNDDVLQVEKILMKKVSKDRWSRTHHQLVLFGRYKCKAINPMCEDCEMKSLCKYEKKN